MFFNEHLKINSLFLLYMIIKPKYIRWLLVVLVILLNGAVIAQTGGEYNQRILQDLIPALKTKIAKADSARLYAFVFLSPECPLCKNYGPVLNELSQRYASQVIFAGIVPGRSYSKGVIRKYQQDYGIKFQVYADRDKRISTYLEAKVTPEVVLLNFQGKLIYRGSIDNWATSLGKKRRTTSIHYLDNAIVQTMHGGLVETSYVAPVGCLINDF